MALATTVLASTGWENIPIKRKIANRVYDLSPVLDLIRLRETIGTMKPSERNSSWGRMKMDQYKEAEKKYGDYIFTGAKVIQVQAQGLLVQRGESTVLIKNYPRQASIADNDLLENFLAMPVGMFKYTSVLGAPTTVRAYDCGIAVL